MPDYGVDKYRSSPPQVRECTRPIMCVCAVPDEPRSPQLCAKSSLFHVDMRPTSISGLASANAHICIYSSCSHTY